MQIADFEGNKYDIDKYYEFRNENWQSYSKWNWNDLFLKLNSKTEKNKFKQERKQLIPSRNRGKNNLCLTFNSWVYVMFLEAIR